jgi:hypothetical protein
MSNDQEQPMLSRRQMLIKTAITIGTVGIAAITGSQIQEVTPSEQRSRDTKDASHTQMRATAITELGITATARKGDEDKGKDPVLFTPEHGFTEEDFKRVQEATIRIFLYAKKGEHWDMSDCNGVVVGTEGGSLTILTNKHPFEKTTDDVQQIERYGEYKIGIVRPDKTGMVIPGELVQRTDNLNEDISVLQFRSNEPLLIEGLQPIDTNSHSNIEKGTNLMVFGYPAIMTDPTTYYESIDQMKYSPNEVVCQYIKNETPDGYTIVYEGNEPKEGILHFYPWKNSEGGSGSGIYRKKDGRLELVALYAGSNQAFYKDASGNTQQDVVGRAYLLLEDVK